MNIGILDGDYNNRGKLRGVYPNLALMKLSKFHKLKGDSVEWFMPISNYDKVYVSKVFTFGDDPTKTNIINADEVECGGSFYDLCKILPDEIEHTRPDYSLYQGGDVAYGFTTRGCIRKCEFCIVHRKEGYVHEHADIEEFWSPGQELVLMDNNILAIDHGIKQIEKIVNLKIKTDFNQGLDARLVDYKLAKLLCQVKRKTGYLRFAFDNMSEYEPLKNIASWFLEITERERIQSMMMAYCLITDFEDSYKRLSLLKELDISPSPQILMDLKTGIRDKTVGKWMLYNWAAMPQLFARPFENFVWKINGHDVSGLEVLRSTELKNIKCNEFKGKS